jgi:hypothetical protein
MGRGPAWSASITAAGMEYLQRADGPNPLLPRQPNISVTQQLVDDLIAAGGTLRLPRRQWNDPTGVDYERRARLAQSHGKVPRGSRLVTKAVSPTELLLELVGDRSVAADADDSRPGLLPVPVPVRLSKYHAVARKFRDLPNLHEVSRKALPRVLRIVHALATEADRRGYEVACADIRVDSYGQSVRRPAREGQLVFTINGHQLKVRIWEKGCGPRGPYESQMSRWHRDREQPVRLMQFVERPKPYDNGATGELNIEALGISYGRQSSWGDRTRWSVEARLSHLMGELEIQAAEAEDRRLAKEREEAERQRQWEVAMENAKRRFIEDQRLEVLRRQVHAWEEAEAVRAYCDAVEARHGYEAISAVPGAQAWLSLAREHADRAQQLPTMPLDPEITHEQLKPYLGGWSPYGPRGW